MVAALPQPPSGGRQRGKRSGARRCFPDRRQPADAVAGFDHRRAHRAEAPGGPPGQGLAVEHERGLVDARVVGSDRR